MDDRRERQAAAGCGFWLVILLVMVPWFIGIRWMWDHLL